MTKSYDDPVKRIAREKLKEFIGRNLGFLRRKDIYVLCLPGAEEDGKEALEVKEIYDPLGIPRENITGLEIDRTRYERLKKADLGIKVVHSSDVEYLKHAKERSQKWNVISLDYTSCPIEDRLYALNLIAGDGLLGNFGVLATNFMAKRETKDCQRFLKGAYALQKESFTTDNLVNDIEGVFKKWEEATEAVDGMEKARSDGIRRYIFNTFTQGKAGLDFGLFKTYLVLDKAIADYYAFLDRTGWREEFEKRPARSAEERLVRDPFFGTSLRTVLDSGAAEYLDQTERAIWQLLITRPYFLEDTESYRYVSNSRTSMNSDFYFFDKHDRKLSPFSDFIKFNHNSDIGCLDISVRSLKEKEEQNLHELLVELYTKIQPERVERERIYLGSSYKSDKKDPITKEQAIDLLKSGCTPEEIQDCFSGFTLMQLAAFKAHLTMGTYDKKPGTSA